MTAFCAFEVNRRGLLGPVAVRLELMGQGRGQGRARWARCTSCGARGADRVSVVWVGPVVPYAAVGGQVERRVLRLPKGAGVNLIPGPPDARARADTRHRPRAPAGALDPSLRPRATSCASRAEGVELVGGRRGGALLRRGHAGPAARACTAGRSPSGAVRDHPDLPVRGVMLDISRDKVPTMDSLQALIDRLASLKVNQVQLYSEHTFAYRDHPEVHAAASPLDAEEIRQLDAFCRDAPRRAGARTRTASAT